MQKVLVNHLFKLAQEKSLVRLSDRAEMTIAVHWEVKQQTRPKTTTRLVELPKFFLTAMYKI